MFSYQKNSSVGKSETHQCGGSYSRGPGDKTVPAPIGCFLESGIKTHNTYRAKHGVPGLTLSKELTDMAQAYAEQLARNHKFEHSATAVRRGTGENLYGCSGTLPTGEHGERAVTSWYNEIDEYKVTGVKVTPEKYSHFSQVVWRDTTELGMGIAVDSGWIIVVANYRPAGNIVGTFNANVRPPKL